MALKVNALRNIILNLNRNPDTIIQEKENLNTLFANLLQNVNYKTWKRVSVHQGNREILKMKVFEESVSRDGYKEKFKTEVEELAQLLE